jgi:hypothetical protein
MAKDPRENRVPMMLSDGELGQIDDWRFANRVATRSDAIRRLVQIALRFDSAADGLQSQASKIFEHMAGIAHKVAFRAVEGGKAVAEDEPGIELLRDLGKLFQAQVAMMSRIETTTEPARVFRKQGKMSDLSILADELREFLLSKDALRDDD